MSHTRALLCTSPLQVIVARSILNRIDDNSPDASIDYIFLIHPSMTEQIKAHIRQLAATLNFAGVFDLTEFSQEFSYNANLPMSGTTVWKKLLLWPKELLLRPLTIFRLLSQRLDVRKQSSLLISKNIADCAGAVDTVLFRSTYTRLDALFISACGTDVHHIALEDGLGRYTPRYWWIRSLNFYEFNLWLVSAIKRPILFFSSLIFTGQFRNSYFYYLTPKIKIDQEYTLLPCPNSILIDNEFVDIVKAMFSCRTTHYPICILILGSLLDDPDSSPYSLTKEIGMYNRLIDEIKIKHNVDNHEIWYKPHPRLPKEHLKAKAQNLSCSIFDADNQSVSEIELCNPSLRAVYSVGSTSLLYARAIFDVPSFRIDLRTEPVHKSRHHLYHLIFRRLNVPEIIP